MTADKEPIDNFKTANQYVSSEIQFAYEVRDFVRDRSQLEREYALKLDALSKKYSAKLKEKKPIMPQIPVDLSTFLKAWGTILTDLERVSNQKLDYADHLISLISKPMKQMAMKKEEARKTHENFRTALVTDLLKTYSDVNKTKENYSEICRGLEEAMQKMAKSDDQRNKEILAEEQTKWKNSKAEYLLQLTVADISTRKYWKDDYLDVLQWLQELDQDRCHSMKNFLEVYLNLENTLTEKTKEIISNSCTQVANINSSTDASNFFDEIRKQLQEPPQIQFISTMPIDKKEYIVDQSSIPFLINCYLKFKVDFAENDTKIAQITKELEGLLTLRKSYQENKELGDPEALYVQILVEQRKLMVLETLKAQREAQIEELRRSIGEEQISKIKEHSFKPTSFAISATCDQCHTSVWGLGKVGLVCQACSYVCHNRCEMLTIANCNDPEQVIPHRKAKKDIKSTQKTKNSSAMSEAKVEPIESNPHQDQTKSKKDEKAKAKKEAKSKKEVSDKKTEGPPAKREIKIGTVRRKEAIPLVPVDTGVVSSNSSLHVKGKKAIALYIYEAGNSEELTIAVDEILELVEDDNSGWVKVLNSKGESGLVPANYIQPSDSPKSDNQDVVALYDYEGTGQEHLKLKAGDRVQVIHRHDDGWWEGKIEERVGLFPSNYVSRLEK